jgi:hypothetical protein
MTGVAVGSFSGTTRTSDPCAFPAECLSNPKREAAAAESPMAPSTKMVRRESLLIKVIIQMN